MKGKRTTHYPFSLMRSAPFRVCDKQPYSSAGIQSVSILFYFEYISYGPPFQLYEGFSMIKFSRLANETVKNCLEGTVFE